MDVVAYLHNADVLIEDEKGVAVIGGSHYVLSVGDRVYIQQVVDADAGIYHVQISFFSTAHQDLYDDEMQLKFSGCRETFQHYLQHTTVHRLS
ncbi:hypothetical protein EC844_11381 [Acinetobacter calcoaceticus]|uniref:Uncharacterized protein n=1 Tax=Acinetobacter calcoaceticus TaxID=471 RepID=A0A4R1XTN9_ACICA|nr:hypothetical protein EC844_11381 [Acinetobacter calcoaceticus]